jgi:DNA-binding response OmpR family regulator
MRVLMLTARIELHDKVSALGAGYRFEPPEQH